MSAWWLLVLAPSAAATAVVLGRRRRRRRAPPDMVLVAELGLERFPPRGAFVQFSNPNAPSRVSLNRLAEAVAHHAADVTVVELPAHGGCAARLGVHSAPTVLLVDATGAVKRRWTRPHERAELAALLEAPGQAPVAAGST